MDHPYLTLYQGEVEVFGEKLNRLNHQGFQRVESHECNCRNLKWPVLTGSDGLNFFSEVAQFSPVVESHECSKDTSK